MKWNIMTDLSQSRKNILAQGTQEGLDLYNNVVKWTVKKINKKKKNIVFVAQPHSK